MSSLRLALKMSMESGPEPVAKAAEPVVKPAPKRKRSASDVVNSKQAHSDDDSDDGTRRSTGGKILQVDFTPITKLA